MTTAASTSRGGGRAAHWIQVALFLAGVAGLGITATYFAQRAPLRMQVDATKTRAYSLSEQTTRLLAGLDGDWTIALLMIESDSDPALRRQIDEVLRRFTEATDRLTIERIDPTDPRTLTRYDALLVRLRELYADEIAAYDEAVDRGLDGLTELQSFARQHSVELEEIRAQLAADDRYREPVQQIVGWLGLVSRQCDAAAEEAIQSRETTESRPLPDYDTARSVLALTLSNAANNLFDVAQLYDQWTNDPEVDDGLRQFASAARTTLEARARDLAVAADPLRRLEPLELSAIGRQFGEGEAAVIIGPEQAQVIRASQIFPRLSQTVGGVVTFDQRFRGEQVLAASIRSMTVEHMPLVVFVHADGQSLLRRRDRAADLVGPSTTLRAARFDVEEWMIGQDQQRPTGESGQPVVWIVVPPLFGQHFEPTPEDVQLIRTAQRLLDEGEPVLISLYPSLLTKFGQPDPWRPLLTPFGLDADTPRMIYERVRVSEDDTEIYRWQILQDYDADHPVAAAVNGQRTYFDAPVPVWLTDEAAAAGRHWILAAIDPSPQRWIEDDLARPVDELDEPTAEQQFDAPVPIVVASERPHPTGIGAQRIVAVGSGGWMRSTIADPTVNVGGGRVALQNPGNYELMLGSIAWLAGLDDLIAESPVSRQVARLEGLDGTARVVSGWILVAGMPSVALFLGLGVWFVRRS
ncbi:MAG: hypothetical protein ACYTGG_03620 [Planctomycetota bacterium]|jgi:hypothetical protein